MKPKAIVILALVSLVNLSPSAARAGVPELPTVLVNDDTVSRLRELQPYIKSLRPEEVPAALKKAIAGHGSGRDDTIDALSGRWVELDAPAALAFSRQTSDREARASIVSAYYGAWAERDPDGALKAANQTEARERADAIWEITHKIGLRDPQRANELLKTVHTAKLGDSDYFIFWNWAGKDLAQATQTLLQEAKTAGPSYPCEEAVWAITDRILDDNPKVAAGWEANLPAGAVRDEAFDRLESEWEKVDSDAVAAWLKSLPDSDQVRNKILNLPKKPTKVASIRTTADPSFAKKGEQLDQILWESNFWRELDALLPFVDGLTAAGFPQAFQHLRNATDSNRDAVTDALVARWSRVDPAGAIKAISLAVTIHDSEYCQRFLADIYAGWARRDPDAAFATATHADYHGIGDYDVLQAIFAELARQDPVKAYATFRKLGNANSHLLVIPIFTEWAVRDLTAATKALTDEPQRDGAIEGIVIGLMRNGPASAIAWAKHLPDKSYRDHALQDIADNWPDDPEAAAAWLQKEPDFDGKNSALQDVAVDWATRDAKEALSHGMALPDGKEKDELLYYGLAQLTYDDAEAAARFAQKLSGREMKEHALATVLAFWSEYDPLAAAAYLSSIATDASPNNVASIASSLSDGDAVSAVRWLDALPASVDKAPAISAIARNWYRADPSATQSWVNQKPAGPLYDAGARGICDALNGDLSPALKWARSIRDPKSRHDAICKLFETAISARVRFLDISDSPRIKGEIGSAPELTDAEKSALIARLPKFVEFPVPQQFKQPPLPTTP